MLRTIPCLIGLLALLIAVTAKAEFAVPSCEALDEWAADVPTVRGADRNSGFAVIERMKSAAVSEPVFGKRYESLSADELSQVNLRLVECLRQVDRGVDPLMASRLAQTQTFVSRDAQNRRAPRSEEPISSGRQTR